ncbi:hypothetical protein AVEN_45534-1 [Araneus ventricosus]|uniref:Uncharacterized protein n=1 Tax=Araneus ventricosus TaxID=182803 RepID=A0A4Y2F167_ARAVE|nr:hypothetical protein AVEN_45534-1 [Araneus ventricosus]
MTLRTEICDPERDLLMDFPSKTRPRLYKEFSDTPNVLSWSPQGHHCRKGWGNMIHQEKVLYQFVLWALRNNSTTGAAFQLLYGRKPEGPYPFKKHMDVQKGFTIEPFCDFGEIKEQ